MFVWLDQSRRSRLKRNQPQRPQQEPRAEHNAAQPCRFANPGISPAVKATRTGHAASPLEKVTPGLINCKTGSVARIARPTNKVAQPKRYSTADETPQQRRRESQAGRTEAGPGRGEPVVMAVGCKRNGGRRSGNWRSGRRRIGERHAYGSTCNDWLVHLQGPTQRRSASSPHGPTISRFARFRRRLVPWLFKISPSPRREETYVTAPTAARYDKARLLPPFRWPGD